MDANEFIKHAPEIAKAATAVAATFPFTAIVKRMLGPTADELAEMWRDQVRMHRYERQLKCVEKAERMAQEAGFMPQAVQPKILFPLLEGASFEEDEDLHTMWAALLANAASPDFSALVRPKAIKILRDMTADEAATLNLIYDQGEDGDNREAVHFAVGDRMDIRIALTRDNLYRCAPNVMGEPHETTCARLETCIDALIAEGLLVLSQHTSPQFVCLTGWRSIFVKACRPPKPKPKK